jgi:hypothetical protein
MQNLFGNKDALIGSIELTFGAIFVISSFIFRKVVANDYLDMDFSIIGSNIPAVISFIIMQNVFDSVKWSFAVALILWLLGGFLLASIIGDGQANG